MRVTEIEEEQEVEGNPFGTLIIKTECLSRSVLLSNVDLVGWCS